MIMARPRILIKVTLLNHFALEVWVSIVCNHFDEVVRAGCFTLIIFLMTCDCYCSVVRPHDVVSWSAVCDCGIC